MNYNEFEDLGDKIQDIIEKAVDSKNYQKLNQTINQAVNKAVDTGGEALKSALNNSFNPERQGKPYEQGRTTGYQKPSYNRTQRTARPKVVDEPQRSLALYGKTTGERVKSLLFSIGGGLICGGMAVGLLVVLILQAFIQGGALLSGTTAFMGLGTAAGAFLLAKGCRGLGRLGRFQRYVKALGQHTYCNFEQLSRAASKPVKFVKKDIKAMIQKGWFLEGHVDAQETCLITSNETYRQYVETQKQLEQKKKEEQLRLENVKNTPPEVQEVLDKGNQYLEEIRRCNDAIPGEEISAKISRIEMIVQRIFDRAKAHPEIISDLKRMMDYYLPMTVKLLNAYAEMDSQPVQGENIQSSKREIEDTIDTLNVAFEKLLDSVFKDTAWDVSSDISVLHTVLAQEGLTEDDFSKMKRNYSVPS